MAIKACNPGEDQLLQRLHSMEDINSTDRYCDVSGQVNNLKLVEIGDLPVDPRMQNSKRVKVFASQGMLIETVPVSTDRRRTMVLYRSTKPRELPDF